MHLFPRALEEGEMELPRTCHHLAASRQLQTHKVSAAQSTRARKGKPAQVPGNRHPVTERDTAAIIQQQEQLIVRGVGWHLATNL